MTETYTPDIRYTVQKDCVVTDPRDTRSFWLTVRMAEAVRRMRADGLPSVGLKPSWEFDDD